MLPADFILHPGGKERIVFMNEYIKQFLKRTDLRIHAAGRMTVMPERIQREQGTGTEFCDDHVLSPDVRQNAGNGHDFFPGQQTGFQGRVHLKRIKETFPEDLSHRQAEDGFQHAADQAEAEIGIMEG